MELKNKSKEQWEQLEGLLQTIDDNLKSIAQSKNLNIEKNYHNWPSRSLHWESDGINRKIEIYLENERQKTYNTCLYSWQDKNNIRYLKKEFLKNISFSEMSTNLEKLLEESYNIIESWKEVV